jgi:UPF0176 protein
MLSRLVSIGRITQRVSRVPLNIAVATRATREHLCSRAVKPSVYVSLKTFSSSTFVSRHQPESKVSGHDPSTYKTLAFYKFHDLDQEELAAFREQLLADFGELGIVGRIYLSTEGLNAQIACPESQLDTLKAYVESKIKPKLGGDLMDLNFGTEHGMRSFRALHVRIRKQVGCINNHLQVFFY